MTLRCVRTAGLVALLALGSSTALAFETVDTILWPSYGAFPAYAGDEPRPWGLRAYAGAMYDDNVTRIPINERGDLITRFGLGGWLGQQLKLFLFAVSPWDPGVMASIAAVLAAAGLAATVIPARRAASIDPMVALREQ